MLWTGQVCAEVQKKKGSAIDTIAVGGRYDKLLETVSYLKMGTGEVVGTKDIEAKSSQTCAVGVSIAIEKVLFLMGSYFQVQCILDYPAMLGKLFPKSWPDKKSIYRRVPTVHHLHHT